MDLTTQTHLKPLRDALSYRLHELRTELHAAELARHVEPATALPEVVDQKDLATRSAVAEVVDQAERRQRHEARLVEAALKRLDEGRYGDCEDCGEAIAWQRLQVRPEAPCCARCQALRERAPGGQTVPAHR